MLQGDALIAKTRHLLRKQKSNAANAAKKKAQLEQAEEGEPEDGDTIVNPGFVGVPSKYAKAIKVNAQEYATKSTEEGKTAIVNVSDDDHMNPILLASMIC